MSTLKKNVHYVCIKKCVLDIFFQKIWLVSEYCFEKKGKNYRACHVYLHKVFAINIDL